MGLVSQPSVFHLNSFGQAKKNLIWSMYGTMYCVAPTFLSQPCENTFLQWINIRLTLGQMEIRKMLLFSAILCQ
jgi:hypothetical protein